MLWHYYNDYTCSVWPWKHQQQKRMNTRCAQQRKSNSSAPQVSQASPNKRNQDTAVMDGGRRTPGRSWTHLTVPCSLSPSCSCIQTPRPDLNPARNSSLVCWASKKPGCSVSSALQLKKTLYILHSCGKSTVRFCHPSSWVFSAVFVCSWRKPLEHEERGAGVCEREREMEGRGCMHASMREWPTSLRFRSRMLEELCLAASRQGPFRDVRCAHSAASLLFRCSHDHRAPRAPCFIFTPLFHPKVIFRSALHYDIQAHFSPKFSFLCALNACYWDAIIIFLLLL